MSEPKRNILPSGEPISAAITLKQIKSGAGLRIGFAFNEEGNMRFVNIGKTTSVLVATVILAVAAVSQTSRCTPVGGVLMTNIGAIAGQTNLGPAFGDLQGSVAATILGQDSNGNYLVQHYWVNAAGETILLKVATLIPVSTSQPGVVPVLWGNYSSAIAGGTGKFKGATGKIEYFGIADFNQNTLVLRYRGTVCADH
jgi:hypothetical protein